MTDHSTCIRLGQTDLVLFKELLMVFEEVFELKEYCMPPDSYLQQLLGDPKFMVYVAVVDTKVIGGLTAFILPSYNFMSSEVYVYDLAIRSNFQRQGYGKLLMSTLQSDCKQRGFREVFVQADLVDKHAIDFYRALGGTPEDVVHFYYPLSS